MAISDERRAWINAVAIGACHDGMPRDELDALPDDEFDRPSREFFASVTDPEELHLFADEYDWDGGLKDVRRVLDHPLCDLGTALLLYWRATPGYYLRYARREAVPDYELEDYDLIRDIEERAARGAYRTAGQPFDPADDHGADLRPDPEEIKAYGRDLPAAMYRAVAGNNERPGATSA